MSVFNIREESKLKSVGEIFTWFKENESTPLSNGCLICLDSSYFELYFESDSTSCLGKQIVLALNEVNLDDNIRYISDETVCFQFSDNLVSSLVELSVVPLDYLGAVDDIVSQLTAHLTSLLDPQMIRLRNTICSTATIPGYFL